MAATKTKHSQGRSTVQTLALVKQPNAEEKEAFEKAKADWEAACKEVEESEEGGQKPDEPVTQRSWLLLESSGGTENMLTLAVNVSAV